MHRAGPKGKRFLLGILCVLACACPSAADNTPLFRYALERWRAADAADRYQFVVFHRGPLSAEGQAALDALRKAGEGRRTLVNLCVETVDLSGPMDDSMRRLWQSQIPWPRQPVAPPWMVVRYPQDKEEREQAWAGPLTASALNGLLDSPARRQIARRLLAGDSIVWVFLPGGNRAAQEAESERLEKELRRLDGALKLPEPDGDEAAPLLAPFPLHIAFSTVRVNSYDRAEAGFVDLLLGLCGRKDSAVPQWPLVFPVFGRGRMLDGLSDADLQGDGVEKAARFLCGPCTFHEKRRNAGVDLLLAADWDAAVENRPAIELPTPVVAPLPSNNADGPPPGGAPLWAATWKPPLWVAALAALVVVFLGVRLWRSAPRRK